MMPVWRLVRGTIIAIMRNTLCQHGTNAYIEKQTFTFTFTTIQARPLYEAYVLFDEDFPGLKRMLTTLEYPH